MQPVISLVRAATESTSPIFQRAHGSSCWFALEDTAGFKIGDAIVIEPDDITSSRVRSPHHFRCCGIIFSRKSYYIEKKSVEVDHTKEPKHGITLLERPRAPKATQHSPLEMGASPEGRRQMPSPPCVRGSLSTASYKLLLHLPGRTLALTEPWHGPTLPRFFPSLLTTCRRLHQPGHQTTSPILPGQLWVRTFLVLPREAYRCTVPCGRAWSGGSVPSQRRHQSCVNGQLGPVEQTEPVDKDFQPPLRHQEWRL